MRFGSSKISILSSGKVVLLLSVAGLVAGCSSDAQRFNPSPWGQSSNQGNWGARQAWEAAKGGSSSPSSTEYTGSIPQASTPQVSSQALPPVGGQSYTPPAAPSYQAPNYTAPNYTAPSYQAPQVSAPNYTAPSYTAPKYTAPKYTAPSVGQGAQDWRRPLVTKPSVSAPQMSAAPSASDYVVSEGDADDDTPARPRMSRAAPAMTPRPVATGSSVIVEEGQTLYGIAKSRGLSAGSIMAANNITDANSIYVGQRLTLPGGKVAVLAPKPVAAAKPVVAPKPVALASPAQTLKAPTQTFAPAPVAQAPRAHTVNESETLVSIARRYNVAPGDLAKANHLGQRDRIVVGQTLTIPGAGGTVAPQQHAWQQPAKRGDRLTTGSIKPTQPAKPAAVEDDEDDAPTPQAKPKPVAPVKAAEKPKTPEKAKAPEKPKAPEKTKTAEKPKAAPVAEPAEERQVASNTAPAPQAERRDAAEFRWPVNGQVISGFGPKSGGGQNDGINIAVPAGTPVKASENGVVLYSGAQVSGYGNLVLVRHEGNYVTAYAHASEVMVKRGDTVKRGQVIARAGQTGNVTQPQLHFEIRRDKTPVNPTKLLN